MQKKRILVAFGTRPEAIKLAPVIHALKNRPDVFDVVVCVTGQHREMLDQILEIFEIKPDYDLDIMRPEQDLCDLTGTMMVSMRKVLTAANPDIVVVHGDTTTTLTAALAAFYSGIKVAHVEAGLRTCDRFSPFPEEINRQIVSKLSTWHFAPTNQNKENLAREFVDPEQILVTGNTVIDALLSMEKIIDSSIDLKNTVYEKLNSLVQFDIQKEPYVLVTGHRRENLGEGLEEICKAIKFLSVKFDQYKFVFPVHLNPKVQQSVFKELSNLHNVRLLKPLEYNLFLYLMKHCHSVLTDSGGIQEEAPVFNKPVLVTRDVTERQEGIIAGTIKLIGANERNVIKGISELIENVELYETMSKAKNPYGVGLASTKIADFLSKVSI